MGEIDLIVAAGMASLGGFIGIIVGIFVGLSDATQEKVLNAAVGTIAAGSVMALLRFLHGSQGSVREEYFYPMGLLGGLLFGLLLALLYDKVFYRKG